MLQQSWPIVSLLRLAQTSVILSSSLVNCKTFLNAERYWSCHTLEEVHQALMPFEINIHWAIVQPVLFSVHERYMKGGKTFNSTPHSLTWSKNSMSILTNDQHKPRKTWWTNEAETKMNNTSYITLHVSFYICNQKNQEKWSEVWLYAHNFSNDPEHEQMHHILVLLQAAGP